MHQIDTVFAGTYLFAATVYFTAFVASTVYLTLSSDRVGVMASMALAVLEGLHMPGKLMLVGLAISLFSGLGFYWVGFNQTGLVLVSIALPVLILQTVGGVCYRHFTRELSVRRAW